MNTGNGNRDATGVIITSELDRRPSRAPDYQIENQALTALAEVMSTNPATVLQQLVELAMKLTRSQSAGISLLEPGGENGTVRWVATCGAWSSCRDGTMPREASLYGEVIARESVLLMREPERASPALLQAEPGIGERLLAPFAINGAPVGTLWAIMHGPENSFEAEDARLLKSLAQFASIANRVVLSLASAEAGRLASDTRARALARASSDVFYVMSPDMSELRELSGGEFITDTTSPSRAWLQDYIPLEDHARSAAVVLEAVRTKSVFELEHRVHLAGGGIGWALSRAVPIIGADGDIVEWFGAASDITARKLAEAALVQSEERQTFLLKLSDALRAEPSAEAIAKRALQMLADQMRLDRCYVGIYRLAEDIGEFLYQVHDDRLPPLPAYAHLSDFPKGFQIASEQTLVIDDTVEMDGLSDSERASFDSLGVRAVVNATLRRGENIPLWAICAASTCPRVWTQGEVALVEEVAERTWAAIERARAEVALGDSEARFRQFSDASTNILWIRNAATMRMEFASPAFDTIYGFPGPDRGGDDRLRSWARLIVAEDRKHVLGNFQRVLAGERVEQEFRVRRGSDNEVRWIKDVEFPLTDEQGRVRGVAGVGQDITAQKHAEEALREREERLGLIVENARDYAIFTIDAAGLVTDWREGAEAVFGWSRAEAIGMDAREIFTLEDRKVGGLEQAMEVALKKGRAPDVRWHLRKDGSRVFIDGALTRLGDGTATGFLKIGQDVTERHRADAALIASEGRLQTLMEGIPQLVWRSCDMGLWTWASPQWLDFTGQTLESSMGLGWLDVIHPDDHEATKQTWAGAFPDSLQNVEHRVRRAADGAWIWHHSRSVPVRNEQGHIVEWLGTSTDVQMLKEFQERQSVLVAELQHRTRNLIAIVRSTSDKTARASGTLAEFRTRFSDRLDALARVQGLLSRLNNLDRVTFDELIKAEMAAMDSDPTKVTLEGPPGIRLRSSTVQTLAMALHELATNAMKYGALGQPDARLAVTWRWEPSGEGDEPWLHIDWRETNVTMAPIGAALRGTGQGRELIERALPYQLSAKTNYELGADGVHCTISLPVSATAASEDMHD